MTGCRVRSVTDKRSGRRIELLKDPQRYEGNAVVLMRNARIIADYYPKDLAGFVVVGVGRDASYSSGFRISSGTAVSPTLFPGFVAEILRRGMVTQDEVGEILIRHALLDPPPEDSA